MDDIMNVLSIKQKNDALLFYDGHREFVNGIIKDSDNSYPPSQSEDKNDVRIWKPAYWKWFIDEIKKEQL